MDKFLIRANNEPKLCKFMITNNNQCNNRHRNRKYHLCHIHAGECKRIYPATQTVQVVYDDVQQGFVVAGLPDDSDLAEVMSFGKHKGKTYQTIIEKHSDYITKFIVPAIENEGIRRKDHPSGFDKVFLKLESLFLRAKKT